MVGRLIAALALLLASMPVVLAADAPPGVSSCSGCHATKAPRGPPPNPIPVLAGRTALEIAGIMLEFKSGARPSTVMGRIAKGFGDRDIDAMAEWLANQGK